jgi:predicted MPP superfamily phosphohydrolase
MPNPTAQPGQREERRRTFSFLLVVCAIFFSGTAFVCSTWDRFWGIPFWSAWQIIPYALTATFIACVLAGLKYANWLLRWSYRIAAVWVGFLNFGLFAAMGCWVTFGVSRMLNLGLGLQLIAMVFFSLALWAGISGLINAAFLRVTRVTVKLKNLPPAWEGKEAVLMSDLHLGNVRGAAFARRVVNKVLGLKPFAVFVSGDLFDGPKADYDRLIEPFRELTALAGVYYVTGNHEEFSDPLKYISAVERAGLRVLKNEKVNAQGLQIVGVLDGETLEPQLYAKTLKDTGVNANEPSILLAHRPSNLSVPEAAGISLQVSGHTHKGQNWPWTWAVFRVHGPFAYGLNRQGAMQVLTSSGAGTWGPPMRVGTRSEIVLIRLERAGVSA